MSDLLQAVLGALQRGDAPTSKWPDGKGEHWALCPYHADTHAENFSVSERGYKCFACGASGGLRDLAEKLGVAVLQCPAGERATETFSLSEYAQAKALDASFLAGLGLADSRYKGRTKLVIPYYGTDGAEVARRYRWSMHGTRRFTWVKGSKVHPYGLWKLSEAKTAGYVYLVEGESDTHTLWSYGLPALGIPGADTFKADWAAHLDGLEVYLWQEPDAGGATFARTVAGVLQRSYIMPAPSGRKDVSEAHLLGDDVPALLEGMRASAERWCDIQARERRQRAAAALSQASDLLQSPNLLDDFGELCGRLGLVGEGRLAKLLYLALTSRLLDKPVSVAVKGPSSGGKSFVVETVLKAFPETAYLDFTAMSEHALVYDERPVAHRFIVLYEATGMGSDNQDEPSTLAYCIRSLLSEGRIAYTTVEKTDAGMQARVIEREGPTGLITTTTWAALHPENETRMLSVAVVDTREQTRNVFGALANRYNGQHGEPPDLTPWLALQTALELSGSRNVTIPYAHALAGLVSPRAVRLRRDFAKVLTLIQAHALLHQLHRGEGSAGNIEATLEDYRAVYALVNDAVNEGVEATVSPTIRETVTATVLQQARNGGEAVTLGELAKALSLDKSSTSRRVRVARDLGYLLNQEEKRGRPMRLVVGEAMPGEEAVLPTPEALERVFGALPSGQHCNTATRSICAGCGDSTEPGKEYCDACLEAAWKVEVAQ